MTSAGWMWLYIGLFLMLAEILAPGFVIFFFGLSALTVGLLRFVIGDAFTLTMQLAAFSVLSVLYLVFLRRLLKNVFSGSKQVTKTDFENETVGRIGKVTEAIEPPLTGRVMIGDAEWTAAADTAIPVGATVKVLARDNLTMRVASI